MLKRLFSISIINQHCIHQYILKVLILYFILFITICVVHFYVFEPILYLIYFITIYEFKRNIKDGMMLSLIFGHCLSLPSIFMTNNLMSEQIRYKCKQNFCAQKTQHINIIHKAVYLLACLQHNGPVVVCYPKHRNIIMHSTLVVEHFIMLTALMPVHPSLRKLVFKGFIIKDKG